MYYLERILRFVIQFDLVDNFTLVSASGDSSVILWDLETFKPIQKLDIKADINCVESEGIDRFDYDHESQSLLVHTFKSKILLLYKYNSNEKKFESKQKFDFGHQIDHFVCLETNIYLLTNLSHDGPIFSIKKLDQNEMIDLEGSNSVMKELLNKLNSQKKIDKRILTIQIIIF